MPLNKANILKDKRQKSKYLQDQTYVEIAHRPKKAGQLFNAVNSKTGEVIVSIRVDQLPMKNKYDYTLYPVT